VVPRLDLGTVEEKINLCLLPGIEPRFLDSYAGVVVIMSIELEVQLFP
jgi:hypothetical protein